MHRESFIEIWLNMPIIIERTPPTACVSILWSVQYFWTQLVITLGTRLEVWLSFFLLPTLTQYMMMCTTYFQRVLQRIRFKNSIIIKYAKMNKCSLHAYLPGVCYLSLTTPMLMTSLVSLFLCLIGSSFDVPKSN